MKKNYKVIQILTPEILVINAGKSDGINENDTFQILGEQTEVFDIDTKESLGIIQNIKETVTVIHVFDKMCECSHILSSTATMLASNLLSLYSSSSKQLNVEPSQIVYTDGQEKTIKIGDTAILKKESKNLPGIQKH